MLCLAMAEKPHSRWRGNFLESCSRPPVGPGGKETRRLKNLSFEDRHSPFSPQLITTKESRDMLHLHSLLLFLLSSVTLSRAIRPRHRHTLASRNIFEIEPEDEFDGEEYEPQGPSYSGIYKRSLGQQWTGTTTLARAGVSGVAAMFGSPFVRS